MTGPASEIHGWPVKAGDAWKIGRQQVARQVMAVDPAVRTGALGSFKAEFRAAGVDNGQRKSVHDRPRETDARKRDGGPEIADGKATSIPWRSENGDGFLARV
jgi:hypothetical protein